MKCVRFLFFAVKEEGGGNGHFLARSSSSSSSEINRVTNGVAEGIKARTTLILAPSSPVLLAPAAAAGPIKPFLTLKSEDAAALYSG